MKLSIIIPVFNSEMYINECLNSILKNKHKDLQIIIVNDGSTDNSEKIINKYMEKDERIDYYKIENHGVSYARNYGLSKAKGKYIMFVDSDDYLIDNWHSLLDININDDIIYINNKIPENLDKTDILKYIIGCNENRICMAGPIAKLYKNDFLIQKNIKFPSDIINGEDMLFNIEVLLQAKSFSIINKSIYMYRQYIGQTTKKFNIKLFESDKSFHNHLNEYLVFFSMSDNEKNILKNFTLINAIFMIGDRISYEKSLFNFYKQYKKLYLAPYNNINIHSIKKILNSKEKIKYVLHKLHLYCIIYIVYRITHKKNKNSQYFFIKI